MGELVPLPSPGDEYVSRRELARRMGVSVRTVDALRAEGMPHESWGLRLVRFNPREAMAWARSRRA